MRSAKSINSLSSQQTSYERRQPDLKHQPSQSRSTIGVSGGTLNTNGANPTSPICRCRVMYLGSSVPHITKDGLQGIQEPLKELYPDKATLASGNAGIDSWLSVWSNGILIENVDETGRDIKRFFKIDALHYCAAVKYVSFPNSSGVQQQQLQNLPKFLPLDSPHARQVDSNPPIFASILRRTTGIKVLECHAFICKREAAANALVRCCFHAYADTMYAKQIGADINVITNEINNSNYQNGCETNSIHNNQQQQPMATKRSKSIAALNEPDNNNNNRLEAWRNSTENSGKFNNDTHNRNLINRKKSINDHYNCDAHDGYLLDKQLQNHNLHNEQSSIRQQKSLSKSLHHLNDVGQSYQQQLIYNNSIGRNQLDPYDPSSSSASCFNIPNCNNINNWQNDNQVPFNQQPFYNPNAGRVPSYPPQNIIDANNNGGTLRSIKSMTANSIASTLLRSKKHAKAMSMAQLNQQKQQQQQNININNVTSFHQPHLNNSATIGGGLHPMATMPPMFLPNLPIPIVNGSQTMKAPSSKSMLPIVGPPMNFEAMTPKEMKKLLKKSAKYGLDPSKFSENGLPLFPNHLRPPPPPPILPPHSKSGTMISQGTMFSDIYGGGDTPDMATFNGMLQRGLIPPPPPPHIPFNNLPGACDPMDPNSYQPMKPILVKPNPEFLKSKAGKKWLKQQKEFKKLLPPHLDGLPIIFGPPPIDALEPANIQPPQNFIPQQPIPQMHPINSGLPLMDSSGYYNPQLFYGQNGRASTASTLLRYSPQNQILHNGHSINNQVLHQHQQQQQHQNDFDYRNQNSTSYSNSLIGQPHFIHHKNKRDYENENIIYSNSECGLDTQQVVDNNDPRYYQQNHIIESNRNHMVEQSVISLGDENDYDDDGDENGVENGREIVNADEDNHSDFYKNCSNEQNYQNLQQTKQQLKNNNNDNSPDSQSNYSSGIYKRGHINERAFSYSIRQEHMKLSGNDIISDSDGDSRHIVDNGDYHNHNHQQTIPVNELTARLENQLNMKSFVNQSRVRSHN